MFQASNADIVSHSVLTDVIQTSYRTEVFVPVNCEVGIETYYCSVAAFNQEGVGPRSQAVEAVFPCSVDGKYWLKVTTYITRT